MSHAPVPHPAQKSRADRVLPVPGALQFAVDHGADPGAKGVHSVRQSGHGRDVGARGPLRDLANHQTAVRALEPFHVRHPVGQAQRRDRPARHLPCAVVLSARDVAGEHAAPLDPGVLQHFQAGGLVLRDGFDPGNATERDGLEAEFAPAEELFGQHRSRFAGAHSCAPTQQLVQRAHPPGGLGAHSRRRLEDQRKADFVGEAARIARTADEAAPCHREPGFAQRCLHPRLVAEQLGDLRLGPRDAEVRAGLRELHHHRLENPDDPVGMAVAAPQDLGGLDQVLRRERVGDPDQVAIDGRILSLRRRVHDPQQPHLRQSCGGANESHGDVGGEGRREDHVSGHGGGRMAIRGDSVKPLRVLSCPRCARSSSRLRFRPR